MNLPFNFLISTSKSLWMYKENKLKELQSGRGVYFGLAKTDSFYVALARNNFDGTGGGNPNGVNSLEFFDLDGNYKHNVSLDIIKDGHQLLYKDGSIYVVNSGYNLITKLFPDGDSKHLAVMGEYGEDIHHLNSISYNNGLFFIAVHRDKKGEDNGSVRVYESNLKFVTSFHIGKHCHNASIKDGFLFSCASKDGKLIRFDLNNPQDKTEYAVTGGYLTRGIIITDQYLLLGLSEFDTRENRHGSKTGRINIYEYPSMSYLDVIQIPDCGQVNDILLA
jgi:hypothetical protein